MDYFLMHECIFKEIIKNKKEFILNFLFNLNIIIEDYKLFEIGSFNEKRIDIILFSNDKVINIELNKEKMSLKRNKIYYDTLKSLLPSYEVIQININLFKQKNTIQGIYNYFNENEYLKFITSKDYNSIKTNNSDILDIIKYINILEKNKYVNIIKKEIKEKYKTDHLIKE